MNFIKIRGKNISITNALREYAEKKILKLEKYFEDDFTSDVFVSLKTYRNENKVEVTIPYTPLVFRAEESHQDMYAAIDLVIDKLIRQIRKYKTKANRSRRNKDYQVNDSTNKLGSTEDQFSVEREKHFILKPMDIEEAVLQMDMLGHNFFVFLDNRGGSTNVVYKRRDGKYGLIMSE
ncbi:ribosome hibernation-promoting factor, HPF/YfiA family [Neobacillus niacini]|uniref:ribosome hibernation-promoting factor, HPF/YfiA family n=1 Tax=Neobacillus niacini TaxID=86668 RepID=UPI0028670A1B|nr:ribosome-associated translation inhibitor RaiA [Neobacillus niacini]MDR7002674.1 putative sigma-54 modulation protein [Neobacillus niacini]